MSGQYFTTVILNDGRDVGLKWLQPDDLELVLQFIDSLDREQHANVSHDLVDPKAVRAAMAQLGGANPKMLGAFDLDSDHVLSAYAFFRRGAYSSAHRAKVQTIVHPHYRDLGMGSALMRFLSQTADEMQLMLLQVEIRMDQQELITACKRLGFELKAILEDFRVDLDGNPYDVIILLKRLKRQGEKEFLYRY